MSTSRQDMLISFHLQTIPTGIMVACMQFLLANFKISKMTAPKVPEILDRSWFDLSKHCMEGCVLCQASRWPGPSTLSFSQTWRRNTDPTWMESGRPQRCPPKEDGTMVTGVANVFGFVQEGAYRCFDTSDSKRFWHTSEIIHGSLKSDPYHPGTRHSCRSAPRTDRL